MQSEGKGRGSARQWRAWLYFLNTAGRLLLGALACRPASALAAGMSCSSVNPECFCRLRGNAGSRNSALHPDSHHRV